MDFYSCSPTQSEMEVVEKNIDIEKQKNTKESFSKSICIKPWGYEFIAYESSKIGVWCFTVLKGHATSLHCHFKKDTLLIVLSGCARLELFDKKVVALSTLQTIFIPQKTFHSIGSFTDKTCVLEIEIFSNELTFSDKNDLLRIDDQYHRKPTGYQSSVKVETQNLDEYNYFEIVDNFVKEIHGVTIRVTDTPIVTQNTISILLDGNVLSNTYVLKEGSIIPPNETIRPLGKARYLTLCSYNWKEDKKIIHDYEHLNLVKKALVEKNKKIILTSGCFDILHIGHLNTLKKAKELGDTLIVCLSSDEQIRALKGESRPINKFEDRLNLFKTIDCVDYIFPYQEEFLETEETLGKIMKVLDPDTWVKGSDYTVKGIQEKHPYLRNIHIFPLVENKSTTNIIHKITNGFKE